LPAPDAASAAGTPPDLLPPGERRRGRRLAVLSHPAGMTHRAIYTEQLPTLALVGLGASETLVGLQRAFEPLSQLLQLATGGGALRKRTILVGGQLFGVIAGLPMTAYPWLAAMGPELAPTLALASLATCAIGIVAGQSVWFPLLRGYVEPGRIGQFIGVLRSAGRVERRLRGRRYAGAVRDRARSRADPHAGRSRRRDEPRLRCRAPRGRAAALRNARRRGTEALAYRTLFSGAAALTALAPVPLRRLST
jgi:hypothetical protein